MAIEAPVRGAAHYLTNSEQGVTITEQDVVTAATTPWGDVWRFQVPVGRAYVFKPGHSVSIYLEDSAAAELLVSSRVKIEVRDPAETQRQTILADSRYTQSKEFQDRTKMKALDISEPVVAKEGYWVAIMARPVSGTTIDASDSYFTIACELVTTRLYE